MFVAFWRNAKRRKRKHADGESHAAKRQGGIDWREVKIGVVSLLDEAGKVVRGSHWYIAMRARAARFRRRLWDTATARGVRVIDQVAVVTDGAKWLRALATRYFTWGIAIRDFYHAVEHLGIMGAALYGEKHWRGVAWQMGMARRMKQEGVTALLEEWEQLRRKRIDEKAWQRELSYFRDQQEAMDYKKFRANKLPIGSGIVESGCKNLIGARFKLSGARWSEEGFQNMLPIRTRYYNGVPIMG